MPYFFIAKSYSFIKNSFYMVCLIFVSMRAASQCPQIMLTEISL